MAKSYKEHLASVNTFVFRGVGALASGTMLYPAAEQPTFQLHAKDLFALRQCHKNGIKVFIVNDVPKLRLEASMEPLNTLQVVAWKAGSEMSTTSFFNHIQCSPAEVLYMGYDLPDLNLLRSAGVATCPADAISEIKKSSHYVSTYRAGEGCVRDVVEQTLKIKGVWPGNF